MLGLNVDVFKVLLFLILLLFTCIRVLFSFLIITKIPLSQFTDMNEKPRKKNKMKECIRKSEQSWGFLFHNTVVSNVQN